MLQNYTLSNKITIEFVDYEMRDGNGRELAAKILTDSRIVVSRFVSRFRQVRAIHQIIDELAPCERPDMPEQLPGRQNEKYKADFDEAAKRICG